MKEFDKLLGRMEVLSEILKLKNIEDTKYDNKDLA